MARTVEDVVLSYRLSKIQTEYTNKVAALFAWLTGPEPPSKYLEAKQINAMQWYMDEVDVIATYLTGHPYYVDTAEEMVRGESDDRSL